MSFSSVWSLTIDESDLLIIEHKMAHIKPIKHKIVRKNGVYQIC